MTTPELERTVPKLADILAPVGDIPLDRILWDPLPGTATEEDMIRRVDGEPKVRVELLDGVLVEKHMGAFASYLAATLISMMWQHARKNNLGLVGTPDLMTRVTASRTRLPDVSFTTWERHRRLASPRDGVLPFVPDLVVVVLSPSNTRAEIRDKVADYFAGGSSLIWVIDPDDATVDVYTTPSRVTRLTIADTLCGGSVFTGFELPMSELFNDPQVQYYANPTNQPE